MRSRRGPALPAFEPSLTEPPRHARPRTRLRRDGALRRRLLTAVPATLAARLLSSGTAGAGSRLPSVLAAFGSLLQSLLRSVLSLLRPALRRTALRPGPLAAGVGAAAAAWSPALGAVPAMAWGAEPKYPPGFPHFDYVRPDAPREGTLVRDGFGSFDKLNPFTLRGIAAGGLGDLIFETLAENSWDEPFTAYGLLAEDMAFAADRLSITFRLRSDAAFSNGDPVTAADVRYSFETLTGKFAHPRFAQYFADVDSVEVLGEREVRFRFKRLNHELHMILAVQLPIFSPKWAGRTSFDEVAQVPPIASGPYRITSVDFGKTISYERRDDYWGRDHPVRRGMYNFRRIVIKYFKDEVARLEGFKAGEFDWIFENSAKNWARGHTGRRYNDGELIKDEIPTRNVQGMQGFAMNLRRPLFTDVRVRQALALAFDFEWMDRQVFFGQYTRTRSYFDNSDMAASGPTSDDEKALLAAVAAEGVAIPADIHAPPPEPPVTTPPGSLRDNLREARGLLEQAGWKVGDDGALRNGIGESFNFEVLSYSPTLERIATPWVRNLAKLGIGVTLRVADPALYQRRLDGFDYDVTTHLLPMSQTPGNELIDMFASESADRQGSSNLQGIRDPLVDKVINRLLRAETRHELVTAARVLDRALRRGWYVVPHFHLAMHRIAHVSWLRYPASLPLYFGADTWTMRTWWSERP